ncbi:STAS domain-containing protein [Roseinatronobacter alkalisoli]|uniref:STAS domain-containing protein n=1 Tax=Roseinatronobacter alkalisoli TaxID=3028235 RepID=A0ABT5TBF4_9RHOB|nr:STAS domain-containing protein [Roseinatronobacter sp. HJB301]MDD7972414.1 STAS domain-containing protein [Roseinatronobacter sp. HJB301]
MPDLKLPEVLDQRGAQIVATQLLERTGQDMRIDASAITRLGAVGLEMLIAAHRQWQEDGARFEIENWSDAALRTLAILDADPQTLNLEACK